MSHRAPEHLEGYAPLATGRLLLVPLSLAQMRWQLDDYAALEHSLGARVTGNQLEEGLRPIVANAIAYMRQEPNAAVWNTQWAALLVDEAKLVGGIGFKGPVNEDGEVEVGYGFDADYQGRGLATEALAGLTAWAFHQPGVQTVIAETAHTNTASGRVLQKNGFLLFGANNRFLYWRKEKAHAASAPALGKAEEGHFALYDLAVVVESIDGNCTCQMKVGDAFFLRNSSSLSLPEGGHFCVYALQAVLPLLPAKQRLNHPADWMETDSRAVCPDPACKLVMRIDRTARRLLHHDDVSPIPWESTP